MSILTRPATQSIPVSQVCPPPERLRFEEIDSLRGLAALSVVAHHFLSAAPAVMDNGDKLAWLKYSPLHLFWSGHGAVVFFFLLSGFVLSLPFFRGEVNIRAFYIKRICRIYMPYLAAVAVAMILAGLLPHGRMDGLSTWFTRVWTVPVGLRAVFDHALLIGCYKNNSFNPVIWSLIQEMRVSLLFPLIMIVVLRLKTVKSILFAALLTAVSFTLGRTIFAHADDFLDYYRTLHFVGVFILGALLAANRQWLVGRLSTYSRLGKSILLMAGVLCYSYSWWFLYSVPWLHRNGIDDWMTCLGASIFVVFALGSLSASSILRWRPLLFTGKISYSLYLYHAVIFLAFVQGFYPHIPLVVIWFMSLGVSYVAAWLSYRYLEMPSIRLGRKIASKYA